MCALSSVVVLLLSACGSDETWQQFIQPTVNQSDKPQRIISLNLCSDQLLLQMVEPQRILGVSKLAHDPAISALQPLALQHQVVQGSAEEILLLKPDLVLVGQYSTLHTTSMLRQMGVRVVEVPLAQQLSDVEEQIQIVASAVGQGQRGQNLVSDLRRQADDLRRKRQRDAAQWPIVAERSWQGYSVGTNTLMDELMSLAGYRNAGAMAGLQGYGYLPLERLVAERPDLIAVPDYASGSHSIESYTRSASALKETRLGELTLPTRLTICGGVWSMQVAHLLAQRGHAGHGVSGR